MKLKYDQKLKYYYEYIKKSVKLVSELNAIPELYKYNIYIPYDDYYIKTRNT